MAIGPRSGIKRTAFAGVAVSLFLLVTGLGLWRRPGNPLAPAKDAGVAAAVAVDGASPDSSVARLDGGADGLVAAAGGGTLAGTIVGGSGQLVADAQVWVVEVASGSVFAGSSGGAPRVVSSRLQPVGVLGVLPGPIPFPPPAPVISAAPLGTSMLRSDRVGGFRVERLPPGRYVAIATHPNWVEGRSQEFDVRVDAEARIQIALQTGTALRGRVVDDRGPVAGAELWRGADLVGVSEPNGLFTLRPIAESATLDVRARGHAPIQRAVDPARDREVEIALVRAAGKVTGVIVDERGLPVGGARLVAECGTVRTEVASDTRGEFRVDGLPERNITLRATHAEHPLAVMEGVAAGDDVRIVLSPGGGLDGEVRDDRTGTVPARVRIAVMTAEGECIASVDRTGRFRALGCAPGVATVRATAPGYAPASAQVTVTAAEWSRELTVRDVRIRMAKTP